MAEFREAGYYGYSFQFHPTPMYTPVAPFKRLGFLLLACPAFVFAQSVSVTVNTTTAVRVVDERVFGVNAVMWDPEAATSQTVTLVQAAGIRAIRVPGGSLSDEYHWATNTTLNNTWTWATSFDKFANVARATNAQVFITVNYGSGTPAEAADWVRYSNVTNGYAFKYWEVGNENYGTWERDTNPRPNDPFTYATRF